MTQAKPRFTTFEEYLAFEDGTDQLYELYQGELIELPPESGRNIVIIDFLYSVLIQIIDFWRIRRLGLELEVPGDPKNRYPDLTVIQEEHIPQLDQRNTIRLSMLPPLIVVEAVSPGQKNLLIISSLGHSISIEVGFPASGVALVPVPNLR